jgi:hypothetical protein
VDGRKQFIFYTEYYEAAQNLSAENKAIFYECVCEYALTGNAPILKIGKPYAVMRAILSVKSLLDKERRESAEGRRSAEYKQWRRSVFERDNYTCRTCGKRGVCINAHHIKSYAHFPDLRYDVSNGITLCVQCHKAIHKSRG